MKACWHVSIPCPMCNRDMKWVSQNLPMMTLAHPETSACRLSGKLFSIHISEVELQEIRRDVREILTEGGAGI